MLKFTRAAVVATTGMLLFGCSDSEPTATTQPTDETAPVIAEAPAEPEQAPTPDLETLLASADAKRGQRLFIQCQACHGLKAGEPHKVGPNLHGFFGRKAGAAEGFNYSPALTEAAFDWSPAELNEWLAKPSQFLPGNRMAFVGIADPQDRANVIAYLQAETQ